eukprot:6072526-Amphidinium_carterae.1
MEWGNHFREALAEKGLEPKEETVFYRVGGLNGEPAVATKRIMWPVGIGGKAGQTIRLLHMNLRQMFLCSCQGQHKQN